MAIVRNRGPLQRLQSVDLTTAEAVFKAATLLAVPEDQTQRQAFESLMPYMYVLRNKGCSWDQLTKLLTECGFRLQPSTVRSYYGEMLATRLDICQERMNEQISLLAEIRKETKGADMSAIAGRVTATLQHHRAIAAPKLDAIFGARGAHAPQIPPTTAAREAAKPPLAENQKKGLRPDHPPRNHGSSASADSSPESESFGLLDLPASQNKSPNTFNYLSLDDQPLVPDLKAKSGAETPAAAPPPRNEEKVEAGPQLICQPIQAGITPLKKRENVAPEVYRPGNLEHPAILGLMLTLEQRLYGAALEYVNQEDAEIKLETAEEKRFRVTWRRPIPMTETMTGSSFTQMDDTLFPKR